MKRIFIFSISLSILTFSVNGQNDSVKNALKDRKAGIISFQPSVENIDTIPAIIYVKAKDVGQQPAYFINGKIPNLTILNTIDPMLIESINVEKEEIEIEGKKYYGQVYIKMKKDYSPQLISLTDLAKKYTNIENGLILFMIDNEFVKDDYEQYLVDEKYLLKIIVDTIENIDVVRLLTRSKENIEKSKEIRIRGLEETTLN